MANLKGVGVPGRTTQGSLGDVYTDEAAGKQYKCIFSYKDSSKKTYDTAWAELETKKKDISKKPTFTQSKKSVTNGILADESKEGVIGNETSPVPEKKNYTNYSKNKRK